MTRPPTPVTHREFDASSSLGLSPVEMFASIFRHRFLVGQLARRSVMGSFGGSAGGLAWVVAKPLLMLAVYTFVFGYVFKSRFFRGSEAHDPFEFALALYAGLAAFTVFAELIGKAPGLVVSNANFVKKVIFPVGMIVVAEFVAILFYFLVGMALFVPMMFFHYGSLPWTALAAPMVVVPLFMMTLGLGWFLASLGVFLRDVSQVVPLVVTVFMFLSPIFVPLEALPEGVRGWVELNPVTWAVENLRGVFFLGQLPGATSTVLQYGLGLLTMWLGWAWFRKTQRAFADVL